MTPSIRLVVAGDSMRSRLSGVAASSPLVPPDSERGGNCPALISGEMFLLPSNVLPLCLSHSSAL